MSSHNIARSSPNCLEQQHADMMQKKFQDLAHRQSHNVDLVEKSFGDFATLYYADTPILLLFATQSSITDKYIFCWIDSLPKDSVFDDIGACEGRISLYASQRLGAKVVAVESETQNFSTLGKNIFFNSSRLKNPIIPLNVAASDVYGMGTIYIQGYGAGNHVKILDEAREQGSGTVFKSCYQQPVITYPLDKLIEDFNLPSPEYLKIDVDGAEKKVLLGAKATLGQPTLREIFIELNVEDSPSFAWFEGRLKDYGFYLAETYPVYDPTSQGYVETLKDCLFVKK